MQLSPDPQQRELRSTVRSVLSDHRLAAAGDPALYADLARAGVLGLIVPEALGGAGDCWVELSLVLEELGAALQGSQFLPSAVLSVAALVFAGRDDAGDAQLSAIAEGELRSPPVPSPRRADGGTRGWCRPRPRPTVHPGASAVGKTAS